MTRALRKLRPPSPPPCAFLWGGLAQFVCSFGAAGVDNYRVVGSTGDIELDPGFKLDFAMKMRLRRDGVIEETTFPQIDHFGAQVAYFSDCITAGIPPEADGEEGLADMRALIAIEAAARTGQPQPIRSPHRARHPTPNMVRMIPITTHRLMLWFSQTSENPMSITFALNRTCALHLSLPDFIALAQMVGVKAVEIRNDIERREFANGMPASELKARLDDAGLKLASVNALQRFNDWNADRAQEAEALITHAAALGAPGVVLCPAHLPGDDKHPDAHVRLCKGLSALQPMFAGAGITGYIEPLGMRHSSMNRQAQAVAAVDAIDGRSDFQMCYDTFQHFRASDDALFPEHIGLVHISGIARPDLGPTQLTEPDRGFVSPGDRVSNIARLRALLEAGYRGFVSMEPFSPETQQDPQTAERLRASLDYVSSAARLA
jgi:2-keto-myo-inositol isomerase